jgi:cation diffusion facilitator family transporter
MEGFGHMSETLDRTTAAKKTTIIGMLVNVVLLCLKLFVGFIGNSAALIADAIHSLSDFVSDIVVLVSFRFTSKPADEKHNYGHGKIETISAVIVGVILLFLGFTLIKESATTIYNFFFNEEEITLPKTIVLYVIIVSLISKELLFRYTIKVGKKINSDAIIANAWHQRSDALSSIAAFIGISLALILGPNFAVLDPVASFVVSLFVLKVGVQIILTSYNQLVDASLDAEQLKSIEELINSVSEIRGFHNIKTRKIGYYISVDVHIFVDKHLNVEEAHDIASELENKFYKEFGEETFVSVHVEPYDENYNKK